MGCKIATEYYKWKSSDKVDNWGAVGADWPLEEKVKVQLQTPQAADQGGW
ncbi:putative receptor recognizing protein Gp38 [Shigella flexneri K-315]|uniref:Putative receptor recognizing protein Gp38 n=2 Tax=Enterobacteriaceae TaxID=543 RepID=I6CQ23_SHIFL|nr:putative receptor recognizing protein Gp38 [Escherichia coli DEC6D]EIQ21615.1 putative receptor recognizing protein Gp38 [Shigella flexneri K-315]